MFASSPTSKQQEHQQQIYSHQQHQNQRWNTSPTPHEQVQHSVPVASGGDNQLSANREQELTSMINYFSHELQDPACTANDQFNLAAPHRTADQLSNHSLYNRYGGSIGSVSSSEWRQEGRAVESGSSSHSGFFGRLSSLAGQHTKLIHHTGRHHEGSIVHSAETLAVQTPGKELYMTDFDEFRSELLQGLELMNTLPSWYICIPVEIRASAFRHFIYIIRTYLSTKARVTKLSRELLFEALLRNGHPFLIDQLATDTEEGPDTLYTVAHLLEVPGGNANMLMERHDEVVKELQLRMPRATFAEAGRQLRSALKNNYYLQDLLDAGDLATYQATISRIPTGRFALNLERLARGEEYGLDGPNFSDIFTDKVVRENVLNRLMPIWGLNRRQLRRYLRRKCINKRDIVLLLQDDSTFDQAQKCLRP